MLVKVKVDTLPCLVELDKRLLHFVLLVGAVDALGSDSGEDEDSDEDEEDEEGEDNETDREDDDSSDGRQDTPSIVYSR